MASIPREANSQEAAASWPPPVVPSEVAARKFPEGDKKEIQDISVNLATCCGDKFVSSSRSLTNEMAQSAFQTSGGGFLLYSQLNLARVLRVLDRHQGAQRPAMGVDV